MQNYTPRQWFRQGLKMGLPIGLGYLAVSFTLGITARNAGLNAFQATLTSFLCEASAGEAAGFAVIAANGAYLEMIVMQIVANARYLLMSFALSQKLEAKTGLLHRLILGWYITDEVFGVSIGAPGKLCPFYTYGAIVPSCIGWTLGTLFGVVLGNILPAAIVSALSVGLYGMFIAIIIPPSKESKTVLTLVVVSMAASFAFNKIAWFSGISAGTKTIILTILIAAAGAVLKPIKEDADDAK